ncbi:MAG TPA: ATP phosphoribosyltransferase regulatory subunit, partial [Thermoleophilaceae bacterium]|nr:ATP phosphoribosyltransferase regulatory subunit [Thermoleophilaceae bacterium]
MIHPIPPGTRDVLPEEMRELRALTGRLHATFEQAGYGEVWTPALEYEGVLRTGDDRSAGAGYRLFDEHGEVLALRSDMTIPIARVVATRFVDEEPPFRLCYFAHSYRAPARGSGQPVEFLQGGIELIGVEAPEGEAEVVALIVRALDEAGLRRHRVGVGDGSLYRNLLASLGVPEDRHLPLLERLSRRDLAGLALDVERLGLPADARDLLTRLPELRGGPEVLERADGHVAGAMEGLRALHARLEEHGVAGRVIFDLGLVR